MLRSSLIAALMSLTAVAPAQAFHDPGYPVLAEDSLVSGDWVRYELSVADGAELDVETELRMQGSQSASVVDWTIFEHGRSAGMSRIRSGKGTRIVTPTTGVLVEDAPTSANGGFGSATTYFGLPAGPVTVIIGGVAEGGSLDLDVTISGKDVTLLSSASGTGTFHIGDESFGPSTHVRGPRGLVEYASDGAASVTTTAPLYAWYVASHDMATTRYEGPARSQTVSTADGFAWIILDGEPAGEHRFYLDQAAGVLFTGWDVVGVPVP